MRLHDVDYHFPPDKKLMSDTVSTSLSSPWADSDYTTARRTQR